MFPTFKTFNFLDSRGLTNGATVTANIDTIGADFLLLAVHSTTSNNATNNPSVFKISESDDTVVTNFADVTKLVGDGTGGWTVPSWHTATASAQGTVQMEIDLRHRKRFLKLTISPLTTQDFVGYAALGKNDQTPIAADVLALVRA
jgi:hypothetical protein